MEKVRIPIEKPTCCYAMHCNNNENGQCRLKSHVILMNGMCDGFTIRPRKEPEQCS